MTAPTTAGGLRGLHLHLDCASGAAGDMTLGALIDLGVPVDVVGAALDAIGAGRQRLRIERVVKRGIASIDLKVDTSGALAGLGPQGAAASEAARTVAMPPPVPPARSASPASPAPDAERTTALRLEDLEALVDRSTTEEHRAHPHARPRLHLHSHASATHDRDHAHDHVVHAHAPPHDHAHAPPHDHHHAQDAPHAHAHDHAHAHHHYGAIRQRIVDAALTEGTRRRALDIFDRLARAEAKLHGTTVDDVVFHEVGAIDSVVDVVGTAAALDWLAPASVSCASVAMGHGTLTCAHGVLPVPAPAALEVMREAGGIMADGGLARELCTPTGAAILAATVTHWTPAPSGRPIGVGWGAGDSELVDRANVLRVTALAPVEAAATDVWQIEANLDDMSPELCGPAADAVFAAGALDVWWTPITMKKGRPALTLAALVADAERTAVIAAILRETTTIGVRFARVERTVLARTTTTVATRYGELPIKVARDGDTVVNAAPEYEACAAAARRYGVPVKLVFAAALAAFDRG